jgi:hypothetical protein
MCCTYYICKYTYKIRQLAQLYKEMAMPSPRGTANSTAKTSGPLQLWGLAGTVKTFVLGAAGGDTQKLLRKVNQKG